MTARSTPDEIYADALRFNLSHLKEKLRGKKQYTRVVDLIARCEALWTVNEDIGRVQNGLDILKREMIEIGIRIAPLTVEQAVTHEAFAYHAIILYSRATDASSKGRSTLDVRKCYSDGQMRKHREIIEVRNQSVAHFGAVAHSGGSWYEHGLMFEVSEAHSEARIWGHGRRANYRGHIIQSLLELCPIAQDYAVAQLSKRGNELTALVDKHANDNDYFLRLLKIEQVSLPAVQGQFYYPFPVGPKWPTRDNPDG